MKEMKDRLLKFLNSQQLTSARFAEIIGVQPSGISHILSGRNKPGFDFIQKILISYPSLNAEWLITGKGNMFKSENIQGDLFSDEQHYGGNEIQPTGEKKEITGTQPEDTYVTDKEDNNNYNSEFNSPEDVTSVNKKKSIQKIVIFYTDKSFSEYSPE